MLILLNTRDVFCTLSCHSDGKTSTVANEDEDGYSG
jgi:hypothetical protein